MNKISSSQIVTDETSKCWGHSLTTTLRRICIVVQCTSGLHLGKRQAEGTSNCRQRAS